MSIATNAGKLALCFAVGFTSGFMVTWAVWVVWSILAWLHALQPLSVYLGG